MNRIAGPLAAVAAFVVAAAVGLARPADPVPVPPPATAGHTSVVCPVTTGASSVAVAGATADLRQSGLSDPGHAAALPDAAVLPASGDPLRIAGRRGAVFGASSAAVGDPSAPGLGAISCPLAQTQAWFVGVHTGPDARAHLVLMNPDAVPAEVNLTAYGARGQLAAPGARGLVVGPNSQRVVDLGPLMTSSTPLAVHLETSSGRVAATVQQQLFAGTQSLGTDWIAPSSPPAGTAVVPGVPAGAGSRDLIVANPGDRVARVRVDVLGPQGALTPAGADSVDVPAASTAVVSLTTGLRGAGGAVRVSSDQRITAAVEARTPGAAASVDWTGVPAVGAAADALVPLGTPASVRGTLTLANGGTAPVTSRVEVTQGGRRTLAREVTVRGGGSVSVALPSGAQPVVRLSGGRVAAAVALSGRVGSINGVGTVAALGAGQAAREVAVVNDPRVGS
ncbi:DUF5719 family protein [Nigerium massiliense]|uniref:DUF5719 family protein n=1 Tax=Nigerium massiliense TaxID=1522317 RepID=UPI00069403A2|nr:DUF5719 family protein [Nigerium massiliense]